MVSTCDGSKQMKIILNGAGGRMGKAIRNLAENGYRNAEIVACVDIMPMTAEGYDCYVDINDVKTDADCVIDFSNHTSVAALLDYTQKRNIPVVLATTGYTDEELEIIDNASKNVAIFRSANMSLGVALLTELAKTAAKAMPDADIEIIEKHHNRKLDAPSGTAIMLANAIKSVREKAQFVFGRHGQAKRERGEIGIHAVRMGNIVGEHEIIIGTDNETITIKHEAHDRALFAEGAMAAADFIVGKSAGIYNMQDMIN